MDIVLKTIFFTKERIHICLFMKGKWFLIMTIVLVPMKDKHKHRKTSGNSQNLARNSMGILSLYLYPNIGFTSRTCLITHRVGRKHFSFFEILLAPPIFELRYFLFCLL